MNTLPHVAILLSTYNGSNFLAEQLDSLLNQDYPELSIIIRDDSSTDDTREVLQKYVDSNDNITYYTGPNLQSARSFLELLIHSSEADYYAFCDQDDVWDRDKISIAVNMLEKIKNSAIPQMYCSALQMVDVSLRPIGVMHQNATATVGNALVQSVATGCTMVFNHKVKEMLQEYMPKSIVMHDLWVFHICMYLGNVIFDPHPHTQYRQHRGNVVGAQVTLLQRFRTHYRSIKTLSRQHYRENAAKQLLEAYGSRMNIENRKLVSMVANYRKSIKNRLLFLFSRKIYCDTFRAAFWLRIRIIIGKV